MDRRIKILNNFAAGMADLKLSRDPLSSEVIVIFNELVFDQYQDPVSCETHRVKKLAKVSKNVDMTYVQELGDVLLNDSIDEIPWFVALTITDLPRIPKIADYVLIDGLKYSVSVVKPMNRSLDSLLLLIVYPERSDEPDLLEIHDVTFRVDGKVVEPSEDSEVVLDILYGGAPSEYSFDNINYIRFRSYVKTIYHSGMTLYLRDAEGDVVSKVL